MSTAACPRAPISPHYRWVILALAWLTVLISHVDRLAWANLALPASRTLGIPPSALGVFITAFFTGYVVSNVAGGLLIDRHGPRGVLGASLVALGASTLGFGSMRGATTGMVLQAGMGLCSGVEYAACVTLICGWFGLRERGRAMGLFLTGASGSVVLSNALVPRLHAAFGWSGTYRLLGAATMLFGAAALALLRDAPGRAAQAAARRRGALARLLRNRDLSLLALAGASALWGTWGTAFWAGLLLVQARGYSHAAAASLIGLFGIGAVCAKPLMGLLSDLLGGMRRIPIIVGLLGFVFMLVLFGFLHGAAQFLVVAPLLGFCAFVYLPLLAALVVEVAGIDSAATSTGLTNAAWQVGSALVPLAVGAVFHRSHSFRLAFVTLACGPLLAAVVMLFVREPRRA